MIEPTSCGHKRPHYAFGLCRPCYRRQYPDSLESTQRWRQNLKDRIGAAEYSKYIKKRNLKVYYKLTPESLDAILKKQDNRCPCGRGFDQYRPNIDHDHTCCDNTRSCGKCIRGALCSRCNLVLGLLEEKEALLPDYLKKYLRRDK